MTVFKKTNGFDHPFLFDPIVLFPMKKILWGWTGGLDSRRIILIGIAKGGGLKLFLKI
jgi:hypothetical protein